MFLEADLILWDSERFPGADIFMLGLKKWVQGGPFKNTLFVNVF